MIKVILPFLPPSSNHAYINNGFGGRTLSAAGKKFKTETKVTIARRYTTALTAMKPNMPALVLARFYFESLLNKGWPKTAKSRYKKLDATNRVKLLEDALAEVLGVDDSCTMAFIPVKLQGTPERVELYIWSLEQEACPVYDVISRAEF